MCGFLVEYSLATSSVLPKQEFISLLDKSRVRGPDSQRYLYKEPNLQFGFNRLSILELSEAGEQPMQSHNKRFTLVFNGEIYNHLELRKKLNFKRFRGGSDSETIAACLMEWGVF